MNYRRCTAAVLAGIYCTAAVPGFCGVSKADVKKAAAIVGVVAVVNKLKAPKPPKAPEEKAGMPKVEIPGLPKDAPPKDKKAAKAAKQAAEQAKQELEKNKETALASVRALAEEGDVQAAYLMGHAYYTGQQVQEDDAAAREWWQKAVKLGHPDADAYLGLFYAEGRGGSPLSADEALRRYKRAAAKGSVFALTLLGFMEYDQGDIDQRRQAAQKLRQAARRGSLPAARALEQIELRGLQVNQRFMGTTKWKAEAKKTPLVTLYTQAGLNAFRGLIVPRDAENAVMWWETAAACGDPAAEALLGTAYYTGRGIGQDYDKAVKYLKSAANKQEALAEYTLGKAYLEGNGVKKNKEAARALLRAAGSRGIADARAMAARLEGRAISLSGDKGKGE